MLKKIKELYIKIFKRPRKSDIYRLIKLSINEEQAGRVILGKRGDEIFICYKNEQLANFFNEWFAVQKLRRDKHLSNKFYKNFIKSVLNSDEFNEPAENKTSPRADY